MKWGVLFGMEKKGDVISDSEFHSCLCTSEAGGGMIIKCDNT
ncbi:MAG TPA: hypothetical protein VIJ57_09250 [Hanamia sp.]